MRLKLTNTSTIEIERPGRVSWALPVTNQVGECSFFLPRGSRAFSTTYLNEDGGGVVEVLDEGWGGWRGTLIGDGAIEDVDGGVQITAHQWTALLGTRYLPDEGVTYAMVGPGNLARRVWRETWDGIGPFQLAADTIEGGVPLVASYPFSGQSAWDALVDLMLLTDCELHIDPETLSVMWTHALGYASQYPRDLIAGANLHNWRVSTDPSQRVSEVVSTTAGDVPYVAADGTAAAAGLPMQALIAADSTGVARVTQAAAELRRRLEPVVTISGQVGPADAAIREGMIVPRVVVHRFTTRTYPCRVLARSLDDATKRMDLSLEVLGATSDTIYPRPVGILAGSGTGAADTGTVITGRPKPDLVGSILRADRAYTRQQQNR